MDLIIRYLRTIDWPEVLLPAVHILLILIVVWVGLRVVRIALDQLERRLLQHAQENRDEAGKRVDTLLRLMRRGVVILIWVVAGLTILRQLGVDIAPVLASAGVAGLAVGFGAQNLVRDLIAGFFIILENQLRVGDVAVINGTGGLVEHINFRTLVLRDLAGAVHIFPNGTITTVSNMTREWSAYVMDIGVAYEADIEEVIELIKSVGRELQQDAYFGPLILEEMEVFGVDSFGDSAVVLKARIKTQPVRQWEVGREYRKRLKKAFDQAGIEIPYPHRSIYFGEVSKPIAVQLSKQMAGRQGGSARSQEPEGSA